MPKHPVFPICKLKLKLLAFIKGFRLRKLLKSEESQKIIATIRSLMENKGHKLLIKRKKLELGRVICGLPSASSSMQALGQERRSRQKRV